MKNSVPRHISSHSCNFNSLRVCAFDSSAQNPTLNFLWNPGLKGIWPWYITYSDYKEIVSSHLEERRPTRAYATTWNGIPKHVVALEILKSTFWFRISMLQKNQTHGRTQNSKALRYAVLRFYPMSIFEHEKFDTPSYRWLFVFLENLLRQKSKQRSRWYMDKELVAVSNSQ